MSGTALEKEKTELEAIRARHGGILRAEEVVEFARNATTALHRHFTWDDGEAAHRYRVMQAREVIRVCVTVIATVAEPVRAYVSLESDRAQPGGGYRATVDVLKDADMRGALLAQARRDAEVFRMKYRTLRELAPLFDEMDRLFPAMPGEAPAKVA